MTLGRKFSVAAIVLLAIGAVGWCTNDNFRSFVFLALRGVHFAIHPAPPRCKERAAEFEAKVNLLRRDAKNSLKPGTKRDDVARFYALENIPVTFEQIVQQPVALGAVNIKGLAECENIACGDDSARIEVRVNLDGNGTVVSDPVVTGMYTECL
jgi:hypothetical protein